MTGAWLALGFAAAVVAISWPVVSALALFAALVVIVVLGGARSPRAVGWAIGLLGLGALLAVVRFGIFADARDSAGPVTGVVVWSEEDSTATELVVLRDDGVLVAVTVAEPLSGLVGERVTWRGQLTPDGRRPGGFPVAATYEAAALEVTSVPETVLGQVRSAVRSVVLWSIPEPSGSLALGVLVGDDRGLGRETRRLLREAGLSHLTAVSGWNVAVVAGLLEGASTVLRMRTWLRSTIVATGIWGYAVLTGLEPPVLRAAAMATLYIAAHWRGWPREPISALGWTIVVLLLVQPRLATSLAFQLSGIATAALCVSGVLDRAPRWEVLRTPLLAQLAVTPLLLYRFGSYSLIAPVANLLAAPVMPVLLAVTPLVLVDLLVPGAGTLLGVPAWAAGRWIIAVAEVLVRVPGAVGTTLSPPGWLIGSLYVVVGGVVLARIDRRAVAS